MKKAILMCTCSFACPSMKNLDFKELSERVRLELPHEYMLMHPRLCEADAVDAFVEPVCGRPGKP